MSDNLTHSQHKAKVMYYCEVLNSLDYRGSMTSLQSTHSGFSCISKASGHHSTSGVSSGVSRKTTPEGLYNDSTKYQPVPVRIGALAMYSVWFHNQAGVGQG